MVILCQAVTPGLFQAEQLSTGRCNAWLYCVRLLLPDGFRLNNCRRVDAMHGYCVRLLLPDCFRLNNCRRVDDKDGYCVRLVLLAIF